MTPAVPCQASDFWSSVSASPVRPRLFRLAQACAVLSTVLCPGRNTHPQTVDDTRKAAAVGIGLPYRYAPGSPPWRRPLASCGTVTRQEEDEDTAQSCPSHAHFSPRSGMCEKRILCSLRGRHLESRVRWPVRASCRLSTIAVCRGLRGARRGFPGRPAAQGQQMPSSTAGALGAGKFVSRY